MRLVFRIDGRLPSLNEMIAANRANKYMGAMMKKKYQRPLELLFLSQAKGQKIKNHANVTIRFYEPFDGRHRRDDDNVMAGAKFILDALVKDGILQDDNPKWVHFKPERFTDCKTCWIEVEIDEGI
jgi:Holliday junction resolvase RusA-like endonuclease